MAGAPHRPTKSCAKRKEVLGCGVSDSQKENSHVIRGSAVDGNEAVGAEKNDQWKKRSNGKEGAEGQSVHRKP